MPRTTFWDIIERTIELVGTPLSANEIWSMANELKTIGDYTTTGKTPWATIAAYCYTDINNNGDSSRIIQTSSRPAQFFLRRLVGSIDIRTAQKQKENEVAKKSDRQPLSFSERDLHPLLVTYANGDSHFQAKCKTIFHETSSKGQKGQNEWLHPDLVGVYFPFGAYKPETLDMQNYMSITSVKLFSFEMKISLNFTNLREYFFQAVSNSSWAHEGYLVALNILDESGFKDELRRLNNAFGIGIIKLNSDNVFESDIMFPARINPEIDWDTVNRLTSENPDFSDFLKFIVEDCKLGKVKSQYDEVIPIDDVPKYVQKKCIAYGT